MITPNPLAFVLLTFPFAALANKVTFVSDCPDTINFYVNSQLSGSLSHNEDTSLDFELGSSLEIYSDAYGGSPDSTGSTKAGILGYGTINWYYLVTDPHGFNMALSIGTNQSVSDGQCWTDSCLTSNCVNAFTEPPSHVIAVPGVPPDPPFYACNVTDIEFFVYFCTIDSGNEPLPPPSTTLPGPVALHPNGNANKCLDVAGDILEDGTPVDIFDCNGTGAQLWTLNRGETKVQLAGTNFCLDAGSSPGNGIGMKIWQCYDNLPAQDWWYTDDNRIALTNQGLCLDLTNGDLTDGNRVQTWQCTDDNTNQVWTLE